ncbi:MAG: ABC transporter permease [Anaerolineales bacterium]|nr:ABC transporter permease [Anaerolineales bacterium]
MLKAIDIALKDMTRSFRSSLALVFMFVMPLLVTGMFYLMFGSASSQGGFHLPRTKVVIANLDKDAPRLQAGAKNIPGGIKAHSMSDLVVKVLQSDEMADLLEVSLAQDAASARAGVDNRQAQVAIIIPVDFSRQFADPYGQAVIEFYQDPTLTLGPGVVKSILSQFMDGLSGIKIVVDIAMDQLEAKDYALVGQIVQQYLDTSVTQTQDLAATLLAERLPDKPKKRTNTLVSIVAPIMAGMMIFYAFYTGMASAESILREEEEGTLPRLFTTPTPQAIILSGKFLAVFLTVLVQIAVLLIAGWLVFRIDWGDLISVAWVVVGIVFSASSFGIFVNSLLKNTKQGGVIFGGVLTFTGMIGMIRVFAINAPGTEILGNTVSLLVPQGWAVRGILQTMNGIMGLQVLLNTLVMLAWSAVFFIVGVWRFNRRYT